jgi:hypothetical protein
MCDAPLFFEKKQDHGQGKGAMCGCILVDFDKIQVINRSAKYKVAATATTLTALNYS